MSQTLACLGLLRRSVSSFLEKTMKNRTITYWVTTAFVAFIMTISGALAISHTPRFMIALAHLGYPPYFSDLLGVGKLVGVCVLLVPGLAKFKEWAYTGFAITVLSACYSHYQSGDSLMALEPLVTLAALIVSYSTRPAGRRLALSPRVEASA